MAPPQGPPVPHGASGRQVRPPHLLTPAAHFSALAAVLQRPEPLQFLLSSRGRQLRSRACLRLYSSPRLRPRDWPQVLKSAGTTQTHTTGPKQGSAAPRQSPSGPYRSTSTDCPGVRS
ncbi:hypothetical protein NDU88_002669 [Pleurodeles waltl]|uniref:Uncharacterized protein n=1 Tax=Pleurodeles waltl TaxID=8319 RepID=A0AAV7SBN2_PLEWA|nr:hypothetical protein NDU88_002669 [Pleurodeles waltl]